MRLALIGLAVGLAGALAVTRVMASILSGVSPRDPVTLAAVAVVLAAVAAVACFIPARRVTKSPRSWRCVTSKGAQSLNGRRLDLDHEAGERELRDAEQRTGRLASGCRQAAREHVRGA